MNGYGSVMDKTTFDRMISVYGADRRRWPEELRDPATAFSQTSDGQEIIARAARLDEALKLYRTPYPSLELYDRIRATGTSKLASMRWLRRLVLGGTMVGLSLAGGLAGAVAMMTLAPPPVLISTDSATAFGELQPDYSREAQ